MKYFGFIILLFSMISCKEEGEKEIHPFDKVTNQQKIEESAPISISALSWIEGSWIDSITFPGQVIVEQWSFKADTLIGKRGTIKNTKTTYSQTSKVVITKGKPVYLLEPNGSAFVSFRLNEVSKDKVSFINIANASPQEISYSKTNETLELTVVSLTPAGKRAFKNVFLRRH